MPEQPVSTADSSSAEAKPEPSAASTVAHNAKPDANTAANGVAAKADRAAGGPQRPPQQLDQPASRGWRFWAVFPSLALGNLLVGLDLTIPSSALPVIASHLESGDNYVWVLNGYLLTLTAFLPLYGQLAQVLGRRWPTMTAVFIFLLGSGISGGATSTAMLIAGRLIQGIGGAGITAMTQLIISDLVSIRDRGKYIGITFAIFGIGTSIGPPVGGVIAQYDYWGWIFWINLPIGGVALILQFFFLQIVFNKKSTLTRKLNQIDWVGNALVIASCVSILISLSWANTRYPWSSWRIILPLVLGFAGMAGFGLWESSKFAVQPTIPPRMFANRTSAAGLVLTFLMSMLTIWRFYFLPVFFQAVLLVSPSRSGVLLLPSVFIGVPTAIISGQALARWGRYKPIHIFGFAVATLASGLYIALDASSSLAEIVIFQIIAGVGGGCLLTTMLPAVQASHKPTDMAVATSTWTFMRSFGNIWGIAIPSAIFNNQFDARLAGISSAEARAFLTSGDAYSHISAAYVQSLPLPVQDEVVGAYLGALRVVWEVCLAFNALGLLLVFVEAEIKLRKTVHADYKLKEKKQELDKEAAPAVQTPSAAELPGGDAPTRAAGQA